MATPLRIPDVRSLKQFIDRPVGPSEWVTITKKKIELFAEATGDHQWIHVDEERARLESPFGRLVAHGFLTLSLAPMLLTELLAVDGVALTINYGIDKIRLQTPVPAGSRVRMTGSIRSVREAPGGAARVIFHMVIELEGATRPACVGDAVLVYVPHKPGESTPEPG
jgi:acyl dehydratase